MLFIKVPLCSVVLTSVILQNVNLPVCHSVCVASLSVILQNVNLSVCHSVGVASQSVILLNVILQSNIKHCHFYNYKPCTLSFFKMLLRKVSFCRDVILQCHHQNCHYTVSSSVIMFYSSIFQYVTQRCVALQTVILLKAIRVSFMMLNVVAPHKVNLNSFFSSAFKKSKNTTKI